MPPRTYHVRRKIRLPGIEYQAGHVFFVTVTTHLRQPWFRLHPGLADTCVDVLRELARERGSVLYAWCVMPDHVHVLVEDEDLVEFVRRFKGRMTPRARRLGAKRRLWQRSFFDHALRQEESVYRVAMYIWENPVRAGMVDEPHAYRWSGSDVWPDFRDWYLGTSV